MLHKFSLENYKSFGTKGDISLYPNPKRTFYTNHIYNSADLLYPVLKHSLIVGPVASGKTSIVHAMQFLKGFCSGKYHHDPNDETLRHWYYSNRFRLPVSADEAPIHFMVEFSKGGRQYEYSASFDGEGIKTEALYLIRGSRLRPQVVFLRSRDKVEFSKELNIAHEKISELHQQMINDPEASVLVLNAKLRYVDNEDMFQAQAWFRENLEVCIENLTVPSLLDLYCNTPGALEFTNRILQGIGVGCTIAITETKPADWLKLHSRTMDRNIFNLFENGEISPSIYNYDAPEMVIRTNGRRKVIRELEFVHKGIGDCDMRTKSSEESQGTFRLLSILAILYRTMHEGKTYIVDGMDRDINAVTFRDLLKYFCESESNGQVIYTTNSLMTMNQQEMTRLDEVNLLEKKEGSTKIIALDSFPNIKTLLSLERNYLDGRFGGRPGLISRKESEQ